MNILLTVLAVASALVWGFLLGTMQPTISSSNNIVRDEVCAYSQTVESDDWKEACKLAKEVSK